MKTDNLLDYHNDNTNLGIIEHFGFCAAIENEKSMRYTEQWIKFSLKDIPDYETFCVLSKCITNENLDDASVIRFRSSLTEYDEWIAHMQKPFIDEITKKQTQMHIDYADGRTDEIPAFWIYNDREEPKRKHISYNMVWKTWHEKEPDAEKLFEYIRENVNNVITNALRDGGVSLYGDASKLKFYRIKKGLSQEKLANLIGVQRSRISKIENGTIALENCTAKTVKALAEQLEISMEELLDTKLYKKRNK